MPLQFKLGCKDAWKLDVFLSSVNTGGFIGSMSIGHIADRYIVGVR